MRLDFLLGKVIINGVLASLGDKLQFGKDYRAGKVKIKTVYDWDGYIDIETC